VCPRTADNHPVLGSTPRTTTDRRVVIIVDAFPIIRTM
jgi:hypothetical protein